MKTYGISRDSPWSHVAWAQVLDLGDTPLLSDWNGEAVSGFDVEQEYREMTGVAERTAFLVGGDGIIRAAWLYELGDFPDFDELLSTARSLS